MAKEPGELKWVEELLPEEGYRRKSMFGGFAYYIEEKIVLLIFESDDSRWNGVMFPVEKEFQEKALAKFPVLSPHRILPKWLYLPLNTDGFEEIVPDILREVLRPQSFWGSIPKPKGKKGTSPKTKKNKDDDIQVNIDTRRPRLFSDEPAEEKLKKAKRISDLKNLGAVSEKQFAKIGITTVPQFMKLGWKKTMKKLAEYDPKHRHSIYAYALIGALTNTEFNRISEEEKAEARAFVKSLPKVEKKKPKKKSR
ncbi:TfoX/Sxy family DNA transformation protein [Bdellovibrio sp. 22V]|uniref:TfoX/Sxy family DNA transformation protein n=1 Tax=Bdellovibrio sp. 22V TaxID=3044166 RepID=UPI002542C6A9|nr:TfoX/Sxy family DNA transformation protein [Bdellovibrio sp. 22V]WII73569.1 TfoX/Sxy family DNA transformation protein [Bdellovibrio sp. 22V]